MYDALRTSALIIAGCVALCGCGGGGGASTAAQSTAPPAAPVQQQPDTAVFPTDEWATATPADMKMQSAKLDQARDYSLIGGGSGFITRHGRVVYTWGDTATLYTVKSASKAIGGIALGLALDDGRLQLTDAAQMHLSTIGVPPKSNVATGWLDQTAATVQVGF